MDTYEFPISKLRADKKDKDYYTAWSKAIYSFDKNGTNTHINDTIRSEFEVLRAFGSGNQDPEQYRDLFTTKDEQGRRKAYSNIDESIVPYMPKLKHGVMKMIDNNGNKLNVSFLDEASIEEKETAKAQAIVMGKFKDKLNALAKQGGAPFKAPDDAPENKEQLSAMEEVGTFKLTTETALELGLNYVFDYSNNWDMSIGAELKENFIDIGVAGIKPYIDPESNTIKFRSVNPEYIIVDNSDYTDYRDAKFFGEIIPVSINDFIINYEKTTEETLTENDISELQGKGIKDSYFDAIYHGDQSWYDVPKSGKLKQNGYFINVLDFVFESVDIVDKPIVRKKKVQINKDKVKEKELKDGKIYEENGEYYKDIKVKNTVDVKQWRRCKWVIDTELVYDYGLVFDQVRNDDYEPMPPFILERLRTSSIVKVVKPNLNALQIDMLKLQVLKSKASGKGLAIDIDSITNISLGADIYEPKEIIKLRQVAGNYFYKQKASGIPNSMRPISQAAPFQEIEGGMGSLFNELLTDIEFNIRMMQDNTGLSDIALAQRPNSEMGLGLNQMSLNASENIISNISYAYKNIKEKAASQAALHLLQLAKNDPNHNYYTKAIGKNNWKKLSQKKVYDIKSIGLKVVDMPSQDEIQYMYQIIEKALQTGKNGEPSITGDEAFSLISMIKEGKPLKYINMILRNYREKREKAAEERNNRMIEAQGQQNQQAAQIANEGMMQKLMSEFDGKMKLLIQEYDLKLRNDMETGKLDMQGKSMELQQKQDDGSMKFFLEQQKLQNQEKFKI